MQKITPCLWFDDQAEEAAEFYVSLFKDSKVVNVAHYGEAGAEVSGGPEGTVMTITFQLAGQEFMALNGGAKCCTTRTLRNRRVMKAMLQMKLRDRYPETTYEQ